MCHHGCGCGSFFKIKKAIPPIPWGEEFEILRIANHNGRNIPYVKTKPLPSIHSDSKENEDCNWEKGPLSGN